MSSQRSTKVQVTKAYVLPALNGTLDAVARKETLSDLIVVLVGNAPEGPGQGRVRARSRGGQVEDPCDRAERTSEEDLASIRTTFKH